MSYIRHKNEHLPTVELDKTGLFNATDSIVLNGI